MNISNQEGFSRVAANATFIIGFARSGTTLLRSLLDNHSELVVFPGELKFFKRIKYLSAERFLSKTDFHLCFEPSKYRIEGVEYQDVLILEAMKMENAIPSTEAGTVKEIKVKVDDKVATNQVLMVLE